MTAILFGIGLLCITVAAVILLFKPYDYGASATQFKKIGDAGSAPDSEADTRWRSLRIRPGLIACPRVANLEGQVFLSREAPELPLPNCTERDCHCHYVCLDDRRSGLDRRASLGRLGKFLDNSDPDRRRSPGRRASDLALA